MANSNPDPLVVSSGCKNIQGEQESPALESPIDFDKILECSPPWEDMEDILKEIGHPALTPAHHNNVESCMNNNSSKKDKHFPGRTHFAFPPDIADLEALANQPRFNLVEFINLGKTSDISTVESTVNDPVEHHKMSVEQNVSEGTTETLLSSVIVARPVPDDVVKMNLAKPYQNKVLDSGYKGEINLNDTVQSSGIILGQISTNTSANNYSNDTSHNYGIPFGQKSSDITATMSLNDTVKNFGVQFGQHFADVNPHRNSNETVQTQVTITYPSADVTYSFADVTYPSADDSVKMSSKESVENYESQIVVRYPDGRVLNLTTLQNVESKSKAWANARIGGTEEARTVEQFRISTNPSGETTNLMSPQYFGNQQPKGFNKKASSNCYGPLDKQYEAMDCTTDITEESNPRPFSSAPKDTTTPLLKQYRSVRNQLLNILDEINVVVLQKGAKEKCSFSKRDSFENSYDRAALVKSLNTLRNYLGEAKELLSDFQTGKIHQIALTKKTKVLKNKFSSHESRMKKNFETNRDKMQFEGLVEEFKYFKRLSTDLERFQKCVFEEFDRLGGHVSPVMKRFVFNMNISRLDTSDVDCWKELYSNGDVKKM